MRPSTSKMRQGVSCCPAELRQHQCRHKAGLIDSSPAADENAVAHPPALGYVGGDLAYAVEVVRIELCVREPVPNLPNAPRCRLRVGVERDEKIEAARRSGRCGWCSTTTRSRRLIC